MAFLVYTIESDGMEFIFPLKGAKGEVLGSFSLTELTEFTEPVYSRFEPTEGLRPTENTERFCYR